MEHQSSVKLPGGSEPAKADPLQPKKEQNSPFPSLKKRFLKPVAPAPESLEDADVTPEANCSLPSMLYFRWLTPLMYIGFMRPLEATDLYKMDTQRQAAALSARLEASWDRRVKEAADYNRKLDAGEIKSTFFRRKPKRKEPSLVWALNDVCGFRFWSAGLFKMAADVLSTTSPILVRYLIAFLTESYRAHALGQPQPDIGPGIGYMIGIFVMQLVAAICTAQFFYRGSSSGVLFRAALLCSLYKRAMSYTNRARAELTSGKLTALMSTDVSRIDFACSFFHSIWASPLQICLSLALLIVNLGPSALAGFGVFCLIFPIQNRMTRYLFDIRRKVQTHTDQRTSTVSEMVNGIRVIKQFAWEKPYLAKLDKIRETELTHVIRILIMRGANVSIAFSLPIISAVVAFITYKLTGHDLNAGILFSSLALFQLLRQPLMILPQALNATTDAKVALGRLQKAFLAEQLQQEQTIESDLKHGIVVENADFTWDAAPPRIETKKGKSRAKALAKQPAKVERSPEKPFELHGINFQAVRGKLTCITAPVGAGKSSFLAGLTGTMRKTSGRVVFGGRISYGPQVPFCKNGTIRENILFGLPFDANTYWRCVQDASLTRDLDILADRDLTEIGEKGISLSGGQKQRVSIARVLYRTLQSGADILLLDDIFAALDAGVTLEIFHNAIQGSLKGKTIVLVTHALHLLTRADYIYVLSKGRISEEGSYQDLVSRDGDFAALIRNHGSQESEASNAAQAKEAISVKREEIRPASEKPVTSIMTKEERAVGSVDFDVYQGWSRYASGAYMLPILTLACLLMQASTVLANYWLVWWQEGTFHLTQGVYMGTYAALAVLSSLATFSMAVVFAIMSTKASRNLHNATVTRVTFAPVSFFDTTPVGRILSRLTRDIETLDNILSDSMRMFILMLSNTLGGIILIIVVEYYFSIAIAVVGVLYFLAYRFYAASAREMKRLDSILRSLVYNHFGESLAGLTTIRAFDRLGAFSEEIGNLIDTQNRAYMLVTASQRWIAVRLDTLSSFLTLIVAGIAISQRTSLSSSALGLSLVYIVSLQQGFSFIVRQYTMMELNMNAVERLLHYADTLEQEAAHQDSPQIPKTWPEHGQIDFKSVSLRYRPELPLVLNGLTFSVKAGERVGICGRTGAGKSSIMQGLLRMTELASGKVEMDGVDLAKAGLEQIRSTISIIPQEPLLFEGTLRSNLDPFSHYDDLKLNDALKRARLLDAKRSTTFSLDMTINDGGENLSVGERALVSLARALVRDTRVILLDEPTSSIDFETDAVIQQMIVQEFAGHTLICIAHRLKTIVGYDRVLVMDAGRMVEFDTPAELFRQQGQFREMCLSNSISENDIEEAQNVNKALSSSLR